MTCYANRTSSRPIWDVVEMLEVQDLQTAYGEARVLHGVSLQVGAGEVVAVVGPNGAGKTTLVNSIARLIPSCGGQVRIDESDVTHLPAHKIVDSGLSIAPEGRRILPTLTVAENLRLGAFAKTNRPGYDARLAEVHQLFPRLADRSQQLAGTMSGGEQQMLAIGRALMAQPRLLLLDEPSLGLAPVIVDQIFDVIGEIRALGVGVLLVEQNVVRALEASDRAYLLVEGRITLAAPAAQMLDNPAVQNACLGIDTTMKA